MIEDLKETTKEVIQAVLPLTVAVFFLMVIIGMNHDMFLSFFMGSLMVILGMILFLLGVKIGMLPIGESIGSELSKHNSLLFILGSAFILSFMATVAEPDVRVLSSMIDSVSEDSISRNVLIISIASGVGFFVAVSMLRIAYGVPIKYLFTVGYLIILVLSFFTNPDYLAIAFDAGGVTTGPMTVPIILALGIGTVSVLGDKSALTEGFGLIGLASIGPILAVMLLGVLVP
ncbi:DUF1538 domain-containing protein [Methanohalophilus halophilus]|uniref:DUF1538 domain-containing protein n=1 Tax=Methanohalophilus halophilus TaxID=2177 RepID=A0A1L3Q1Y9_9EURY|nr:DUF1538 domain-containing protein [Methanohalophilus halophilus]APH38892.1 hypothetical protein BHR79_04890 [Methanohalophilus halophilus]RNI07481.1 DUF1538 domain-containing protein [Methanohalophilus halophilus]SDW67938.1 Protein of unknown function [Methanohalophilus halophilus]